MAVDTYRSLFSLTGEMVMVAGGAGAIGSAMARAVAGFGARIAIADVAEGPRNQVVSGLQAEGVSAVGVLANVLDPDYAQDGHRPGRGGAGPR